MQLDLMTVLGVGLLVLGTISMFGATFFTVDQRTTAIVQRLGGFVRKAGSAGNIGELVVLEAAANAGGGTGR